MEITHPVQIPAGFAAAETLAEKVILAIAEIGKGSANEIVRFMKWLKPGADNKRMIADTHNTITELYMEGLIEGVEENGDLVYHVTAGKKLV